MALKAIILLALAIASNSQSDRMMPPLALQASGTVCSLPIVPGPCRASIPSFGYNGKTGQCEAFIYGGCKGNKNRFASERACSKTCETNPVALAAASSVFCPQDVKTCEDGSFVGRDSTKGCAFKPCPPCSLPKEIGPCKAAFSRFYFNAESGACEQFTYGGCAGNGNNFETEKECQKTCDPSSLVCTLDVEECPDGSFVSRDPLNDCEFEECPIVPTPEPVVCTTDVKECSDGSFVSRNPDNDCAFDPCPPCSLKYEIGNCEALIPRFYYDASTGECESFNYGGCGGNENNFETEMECAVACKEAKACTKDAKLCPSGIALGRDPYNNCEFPDCVCGGFENCRSYFDGCKKCKCNADGTETCVENDKLKRLCNNGSGRRKMESKCLRCKNGYSVNSDGKCQEDVVKPVDPVFCTMDMKQCPDGSYVGRAGPNCEFKPCP